MVIGLVTYCLYRRRVNLPLTHVPKEPDVHESEANIPEMQPNQSNELNQHG
jgi:hypothetical protein